MKKIKFDLKKTSVLDPTKNGVGTTDDEMLIQQAKCKLDWALNGTYKKIVKRYNIDENDPEPGLLRYAKARFEPYMNPEDEIIPRSEWNLESLYGESELQLFHPHYQIIRDYIKEHYKPKHKILLIMECTNAKPYISSKNSQLWAKEFGDKVDMAVMSNLGVILLEYSNYYPYRQDNWDHTAETPDMTELYTETCAHRAVEFKEHFGYEHVVVVMQSSQHQKWADYLYNNNIAGAKDWLHIVTTQEFKDKYYESCLPIYKKRGMAKMRMMASKYTRKAAADLLETLK